MDDVEQDNRSKPTDSIPGSDHALFVSLLLHVFLRPSSALAGQSDLSNRSTLTDTRDGPSE
jgi:hypothetical protein